MGRDNVLTLVLVACALVTTSVATYRLLDSPDTPETVQNAAPVFIDSWRAHIEHDGLALGPTDAPVHLIEFADFECPYCASLSKALQALRAKYPAHVALSFVHYPIVGHRFAEMAAIAAECAHEQGRFEAMHDTLFENQRALGQREWADFARDAKVPDISAFDSCLGNPLPRGRVSKGKQLGDQLNVQGTPTIIINGWKLSRPPSLDELDHMVQLVLAGKSPVPNDPAAN